MIPRPMTLLMQMDPALQAACVLVGMPFAGLAFSWALRHWVREEIAKATKAQRHQQARLMLSMRKMQEALHAITNYLQIKRPPRPQSDDDEIASIEFELSNDSTDQP